MTTRAATVRPLAAALGLLAVVILAARAERAARDLDTRDAQVRQVCQRYAGLDLSGMAHLCHAVGYQQRITTTTYGG